MARLSEKSQVFLTLVFLFSMLVCFFRATDDENKELIRELKKVARNENLTLIEKSNRVLSLAEQLQ